MSVLGAAAVVAGLGSAAIAGPGGAPTALTPTSELAADGGAAVPGEAGLDGAAAVPVAEPAPAPVETAPPTDGSAPVPTSEPAPAPGETLPAEEPVPVDDGAAEPEVPEAGEEPMLEEGGETEEIVEPPVPTRGEVLAGTQRPLVPVAILSAPVESASDGEPLVATGEVIAITAQEDEGDGGEDGDQTDGEDEDEDEVIIPVDPGDKTPEEPAEPPAGDEEPTTVQPEAGAPQAIARGDRLALTGLALEGPFGAGLVLLVLGGFLRITARPSASPAPA